MSIGRTAACEVTAFRARVTQVVADPSADDEGFFRIALVLVAK
jgi:hypothetical protein